jgi:hypothetical protein
LNTKYTWADKNLPCHNLIKMAELENKGYWTLQEKNGYLHAKQNT